MAWLLASEEPAPAPAAQPPPPAEFTATHLVGRYRGEKQWSFRTDRMVARGDVVELKGLHDGVIYREGKPYLTVEAPEGIWYQNTNDLDLLGGVRVTYRDEMEFVTERLRWQAAAQRLVVPGPVTFRNRDGRMQAGRLEAAVQQQTVTLAGGVRVEWTNGLVWTMEQMTYYVDRQWADVMGDVQVQIALPERGAGAGQGEETAARGGRDGGPASTSPAPARGGREGAGSLPSGRPRAERETGTGAGDR